MGKTLKIAVVGGGPSGMAAAITAARLGARVMLLEAQSRVGRKLLSTGNGRCNITNARIDQTHFHSAHHAQVMELINRVQPGEIMDFLRSLGLECFEEREGRIYPRSEQATAVLDMLRAELDRLGVEIISDSRITAVSSKNGFLLKTGQASYSADRVIMACGSQAAPQLGGCADGMELMKKLGHRGISFTPALVGLKVDSPHLKTLKGVRWRCRLKLINNGDTIHAEDGEIQFNEDNLSGIVTMQMSSRAARQRGGCVLSLDLLPEYTKHEVCQLLQELRQRLGHMPMESFLAGLLNKRLAVCLLKEAGITRLNRSASDMSDKELKVLGSIAKDWQFPITGTCGWKSAQVAAGGIALNQFDQELQSRFAPGLYACGELLDCDGDCGGYNLHWAWCTGIIAGRAAAGNQK